MKIRFATLAYALIALLVTTQSLLAAEVRITTWNLNWFPNGTPKEASAGEQQRRIQSAANVLRRLNPDIILLQEIHNYEVTQKLADAIKPGTYQIAICSAFKDRGQIGKQQVVILAKQPAQAAWAESWKSMDGVDPPRGFAFAWFKIKGEDVGIYCVHLKSNLVTVGDKAAEGSKNVRKREVASQQLLDHIRNVVGQKMPSINSFVIGGDFNTNADQFGTETTMTALEQNGFQNCMAGIAAALRVTHPRSHGYPDATFDYFFAKGATSSEPEITRSEASDHLPITCIVTFGGSPNAIASSTSQIAEMEKKTAPSTPQPTATPEQFVTITRPVTVQVPYGTAVLQPGIRLPVLSRDSQTVDVRYMNAKYTIPMASTDLK